MKTFQWVLLSVLGLIMLTVLAVSSGVGGYLYSQVSTTPEVIVETVEVPVIVTQEVIVTKEIMVTPTPEITEEPVVTESPAAMPAPEEGCVDSAWVVMQPTSNIDGNAIKTGQIKRLHFRIRNEGTCVWDNYVLSSDGVFEDIPVPLTYPGEIADFTYDFIVDRPLEARWYLKPPVSLYGVSQPLLMSNSASPGVGLETMYFGLDVAPKTPKIPCGPYGCNRSDKWRYR